MKDTHIIDTAKIEINPYIPMDVNGHLHTQWFEVDKTDQGTIISCPNGCRRYLMKNGSIAHWDKDQGLWVKGL